MMKFIKNHLNELKQLPIHYWVAIIIMTIISTIMICWIEVKSIPKTNENYHSIVNSNCLLCNNKLNGTDSIAYIYFNRNCINIANIGLKEYCVNNEFLECNALNVPDSEIRNDEYHEHDNWISCISIFESPDDIHGTVGVIKRFESQFSYGKISKASNDSFADTKYLTTILCQKCFEDVYPITRNFNGFLYDFQTGSVFSMPVQASELVIRDYSIDFVFVSKSEVIFTLYKNL